MVRYTFLKNVRYIRYTFLKNVRCIRYTFFKKTSIYRAPVDGPWASICASLLFFYLAPKLTFFILGLLSFNRHYQYPALLPPGRWHLVRYTFLKNAGGHVFFCTSSYTFIIHFLICRIYSIINITILILIL